MKMLHILVEKRVPTQLTFAAGLRRGDSPRHPGGKEKKRWRYSLKVTKNTHLHICRTHNKTFSSLPLVPRGAGEPERHWDVSWRPAQAVWKWGLWRWRKYEPTLSLETHTCPPECFQTRCSERREETRDEVYYHHSIEQHMNIMLLT